MLAAIKNMLWQNHGLRWLARMLDNRKCRRHGCSLHLGRDGSYLGVRKGQKELRLSISHYTYIHDAAQRIDYYFDCIDGERMGEYDVADFSKPKLHKVRGIDESFLFTSMPEGVTTAAAYLKAFEIRPGEVIIDAGAYCGLTAFLFAKAVGADGKVLAVEADPRNYSAMATNLSKHDPGNVVSIHAAIWKETGHLEFASEGNMGSAVSAVNPGKYNKVDVPSITLSDIAKKWDLKRIDHVKMDIEGAEYEVLLSSAAFIEKYRPDFLVEVHEDHEGVVNVATLQDFFSGLGYGTRQTPQPGDEIYPLVHFYPTTLSTERQHQSKIGTA